MKRLESRAAMILLAAGVTVGVAIALDGALSRAINGVSGLLWFLAAFLFARRAIREPNAGRVVTVTVTTAVMLVLVVRPSDLISAAIGFTIGGAIVALAAGARHDESAMLLPALWLPIHLLVAISRAAERAIRDLPAHVRTEPPPTAAMVPLAMIVASFAGGYAVTELRRRRRKQWAAASAD